MRTLSGSGNVSDAHRWALGAIIPRTLWGMRRNTEAPFEVIVLVQGYDTGTGYIRFEHVRGIGDNPVPEWFRTDVPTEERLSRMRPEEFLALVEAGILGMPIASHEEGAAWASNRDNEAFLRPRSWLGFRSSPSAAPSVFVEVAEYDRASGEIRFRDIIFDERLPAWFRVGVEAAVRQTHMSPEELMWHLETRRVELITAGPTPEH